MPWKVLDPMTERMQFVARLLHGERMTDVCEAFGISRKTGYKLWERYQRDGLEAFKDGSHRPLSVPHETPRDVVQAIVALRAQHPTWGPKKLRERLLRLDPTLCVPAASTVGAILSREGLVKARVRRRRASPTPTLLLAAHVPNELWAMDFKGEFKLGNRRYCYPLTVTDDYSRFLLGCEALEATRAQPTQTALIQIFREFGLPDRMRTDNGSPFASTGRCGLTQLSVWLMRLGIKLERIEPGHPEQNGRHERMHRTLKQECTQKPAHGQMQQQERFDAFRHVYNHERPHEALNMKTPTDVYKPSKRRYPEKLAPLTYPNHELTRRVYDNGHALLPGRHDKVFYVGQAFCQQLLGLTKIADRTWAVSFVDLELGLLDEHTGRLIQTSAFDKKV